MNLALHRHDRLVLAQRRPDPLGETVEKVVVERFAIACAIDSFKDSWRGPCPCCVCLARCELPCIARLLKLIPIRVTDPHELAMLNLEARELARLCKRCFYFLKRAKSDGNGGASLRLLVADALRRRLGARSMARLG
jgi:hypothetical protein